MIRHVVLGLLASSTAFAGHAGVRPGEGFTYLFSMGPIQGARARMSVGQPTRKDGRSLVAVQGEAETVALVRLVAPMNASYLMWLDPVTLMPREVTSTETGLHDVHFHTLVDGRELKLDVASPRRNVHLERHLPREPRDPLSAYFALRAQALANGDRYELDVLDGAALWRTRLTVVGREPISLGEDPEHPSPPVASIRLEGTLDRIDDRAQKLAKIPQRTISLWLSDDDPRVLLRATFDAELGRAKLDLTSYAPPSRSKKNLAPVNTTLPGVEVSAR